MIGASGAVAEFFRSTIQELPARRTLRVEPVGGDETQRRPVAGGHQIDRGQNAEATPAHSIEIKLRRSGKNNPQRVIAAIDRGRGGHRPIETQAVLAVVTDELRRESDRARSRAILRRRRIRCRRCRGRACAGRARCVGRRCRRLRNARAAARLRARRLAAALASQAVFCGGSGFATLPFASGFGIRFGGEALDLLDEIDRDDVVIDDFALDLDRPLQLDGNRRAVGRLRCTGDVVVEVTVDHIELRGERPREMDGQRLAVDFRVERDRGRPFDRDPAVVLMLAGADLDLLGRARRQRQRGERERDPARKVAARFVMIIRALPWTLARMQARLPRPWLRPESRPAEFVSRERTGDRFGLRRIHRREDRRGLGFFHMAEHLQHDRHLELAENLRCIGGLHRLVNLDEALGPCVVGGVLLVDRRLDALLQRLASFAIFSSTRFSAACNTTCCWSSSLARSSSALRRCDNSCSTSISAGLSSSGSLIGARGNSCVAGASAVCGGFASAVAGAAASVAGAVVAVAGAALAVAGTAGAAGAAAGGGAFGAAAALGPAAGLGGDAVAGGGGGLVAAFAWLVRSMGAPVAGVGDGACASAWLVPPIEKYRSP